MVLLLAVPLSAGVLASRSDEPWGSRAEEWVAQYLLVNGTATGYDSTAAAFYAPGARLDLRPQSGLEFDPAAGLRPYGGVTRPAATIDEVEPQGVYVSAGGTLVTLAGPPRHPFMDGTVVSPSRSLTRHPQERPRHFAVVLEVGAGGISRQTELADLDTWGTAPRHCDDAAAERVLEGYLGVWSGAGSAGGVYRQGAVVVD
ncbi:MAG TPA: hypothetical protein VFR74_02330, partial [Jiangellales bacterium]|nr:hypothetical protein [Jiangellales bacterium]